MIRFYKRLILVVFITLFLFSGNLTAQTKVRSGNMYTQWMKLALVGKNQAEIEYYFRNIDSTTLDQIKDRIRFAVLDNLRRSGIHELLRRGSDMDDFNVITKKILVEIRYVGMEHDEDLKLSIKEEFGVLIDEI